MKKTPIILRSLFAVCVVAVFAWSMFPLQEADFYDTFLSITDESRQEEASKLVDHARELQKKVVTDAEGKQKKLYTYPSNALEQAAIDLGKDGVPVKLSDLLKKNIKRDTLKTNNDVISLIRKNASGAVHLGIDLAGGAEFLIQLKSNKSGDIDFEKQRDNAIETIRKRLESQNFYECEIASAGQDLVSVRVPVVGEDNVAQLEKLILTSAQLDFRLVPVDGAAKAQQIFEAYLAAKNQEDGNLTVEDFYKRYTLEHPEDTVLSESDLLYTEEADGKRNYVLVSRKVEMDGKNIKDADVTTDQYGQRMISLSFDDKGAVDFANVTSANVKRQLAIVLDGKLYSAPVLQTAITGGNAQITGNFSEEEAKSLADALVSGSLPFEITVVSRANIESSVGKETIEKSIWSGIIGTVLVMIFMVIYYRLAGLVANISLLVNALVLLGAIAAFDVTLTLPGIAGIVLTIGMAVDANVLIYERIRDEIKGGKSIANAVNIGFDRAFSAIFDSNLTTLFVAVILFWLGSGSIKGFAITLAIGIFTTLFTAVFLTRIVFDLILRIAGPKLKTLKMMQFCTNPNFDFISMRKITIIVSGILVVGSLVLMGVKGKDMLGMDFTSGMQILVEYKQAEGSSAKRITVDQIEKQLAQAGYNTKATYKTSTTGDVQLDIVVRDAEGKYKGLEASELDKEALNIAAALNKANDDWEFVVAEGQTKWQGPQMSAAFARTSIIALICSMIGMVIYLCIRFQFSYSIAANIALVHDVIVSLGIYLALGGQLTLQVVASLLTLIGYSVNDTIVTFDRQRENLTLMEGKNYFEVVNTSINQTLGRTILTSLSVVLILVSQLIFGGEGIKDFVLVMLIGCFVGCYSSIMISPLITAYWHKKESNIREVAKDNGMEKEVEA